MKRPAADDIQAEHRQHIRAEMTAGAITLAAAFLLVVNTGTGDTHGIWGAGDGPRQLLAVAVCLNVALILYAWRRTRDLQAETRTRVALEREAALLAMKDHVSGLLGRRAFFDQAAPMLAESGRGGALLLLDLDHFKSVNDLYGHHVGDELLRSIAATLTASAGPDSLLARLGGDEFAILLVCDSDVEERASHLADEILAALGTPIEILANFVRVSSSIGIATADTGPSACIAELLRQGDLAMYEAKRMGRNCKARFDTEIERSARARSQLETEIRTGVAAGQFIPFYQPQTDLESGELIGFEVLARWEHPTRGCVPPGAFLLPAEETGMITELSLSVMRRALLDARDWDPRLQIAINLSTVQFKDAMLADRLLALLGETGFPAERLQLEVTESAFLHNRFAAMQTLTRLKEAGITISLEDFGRSFSSFTKLKGIPFDRIKIDRDFVLTMAESEESAAIVTAITRLAASLNVPVAAEGVEDQSIMARLRLIGCAEGQGWLFGRPMPVCEVRILLGAGKPQAEGDSAAEAQVA